MWDVVIVGGGVGGLTAGALLSKSGFKTLLLEGSDVLGGRASNTEYKKGYAVDYGIHLLRFGDKGIAAQVFKILGEGLEILEPGEGKLFEEGRWLELPTKADALMRTTLLDAEDKKLVGNLLTRIIGTPPQKALGLSVAEWLRDIGGSKRIDWIMRLISKLCITTDAPDTLSAGEVFAVITGALKAGKSVGYPAGGWKTITEKLSSVMSSEGGRIRTGAQVDKIQLDESKRIKGVVAKGERIEANSVVYAAPCQQLGNLMGERDVGVAFIDRATNMIPTSGVSIDFGLRGKISDMDGMAVMNDPFILMQITSNIDPSVAPSGEQLATFLHVLPSETFGRKNDVEKAFEILEKYAYKMFPKMKSSVIWKRKIAMNIVDGVLPTPMQSREKRIGFVGPLKGFYFAGDCYDGEGGGSDIAFHSGKRCAEVIGNK